MHDIQRLPGAKIITGLLWAILAAGALAWLAFRYWPSAADLAPKATVQEHVTLSVLQNEALVFLVTRRTATQIVVEHEETSWLGQWRGVLWATVRIHYGVDLAKIGEEDVRREGEVTLITLPEPQVLDFSIEPGSIGFLSKSTAASKITDILHNGQRRLLEGRLRECALEFAQKRGMLPARAELVQQLNQAASLLAREGTMRLQFE